MTRTDLLSQIVAADEGVRNVFGSLDNLYPDYTDKLYTIIRAGEIAKLYVGGVFSGELETALASLSKRKAGSLSPSVHT